MASEISRARSQKDVSHTLELIHEAFGPLARRVFDAVCRRESLTLEQIVDASGVQKRVCGLIMYVLVKHDCVSATSNLVQASRSKPLTTYSVDLVSIKRRNRFSRYLQYIQSRFTKEHHFIIFNLLIHGAISFEQMLIISQQSNHASGGRLETVSLRKAFKELAAENLIHDGGQAGGSQQSSTQSVDCSLMPDYSRINTANACSGVRNSHIEGPLPDILDESHFWRVNVSKLEHEIDVENRARDRSCRSATAHRQKLIEAVIRSRLGCQALRIFRVLLNFQLEQKQIAELSMVPIKDTRDLLYKLLKCGYVRMQEVARTHDHAPSRTNYLWRVSCLEVESVVEKEIIQTMSNVNMRLLRELKEDRSTALQSQSRMRSKSNRSSDADRNRRIKFLELTLLRLGSVLQVF
jgi:DNA-directed RNA polymerase III subunit RPC3